MAERRTGHVLNQAGRWHVRGQPSYEPSFDTETDALALKDDLLALFPWAEVVLRDATRPEASATTFNAPDDQAARFAELVRLRHSYLTSSLRRIFGNPPPDPWDPASYVLER